MYRLLRPRRHVSATFAMIALLCVSSPLLFADDVEGSSDHPLVPRVGGAVIVDHIYRQLEQVSLPVGPAERVPDPDNPRRGTWTWPESEEIEGEHWSIVYTLPEDASTLHVLRSYTQAFEEAGFEVLFSGSGDELDGQNGYSAFFANNDTLRHTSLRGTHQRSPRESDFRYIAAGMDHPEYGRVVVAVSTFNARRRGGGTSIHGGNPTIVAVEIAQSGELEIVMEHRVLEPDDLERGLIVDGRIAVHNILFGFDSAEILPESAESLGHIASLMRDRPDLNLLVVGHTDSVGSYDYNLDLSYQRARSVSQWLTSEHGIPAERLRPAGAGMMSPATSNRTEAGRELNRRVELVEIVQS